VQPRAYTPAGVAAAAAGTFAWGVGIILIKLTTSPFLIATFYRHVFSVPIMLAAWAVVRDKRLPWRAASFGGLLFAAHQIVHFASLRYSTAAVVTIFFSLQPILVGAAGRRVTGEAATLRFYLVAIGGCATVVLTSGEHPNATPLGTFLAVANLLIWSAYYLATKRARSQYGTVPWLLVMLTVSGTVIGLIALAARQPFGAPEGNEWVYLLALAIFPGTIGHLLVTWAQPRIHAAASSGIIIGVPIVAAIGAAIFVDETFGPRQAVGALIALGGTVAAMRHLPPPVNVEAAERYGEVAT
jgi:drug/metabolite transporter (DMT)-like permease